MLTSIKEKSPGSSAAGHCSILFWDLCLKRDELKTIKDFMRVSFPAQEEFYHSVRLDHMDM